MCPIFLALNAKGGFSSVGRASALQAEGQRFESAKLHHFQHQLQVSFDCLGSRMDI